MEKFISLTNCFFQIQMRFSIYSIKKNTNNDKTLNFKENQKFSHMFFDFHVNIATYFQKDKNVTYLLSFIKSVYKKQILCMYVCVCVVILH